MDHEKTNKTVNQEADSSESLLDPREHLPEPRAQWDTVSVSSVSGHQCWVNACAAIVVPGAAHDLEN